MKKIIHIFSICIGFLLISCDSKRIYETNIDFKENKWFIDSLCTYQFQIDDITMKYNMLYIVRNTLNYPYYNLYVTYYLYGPDQKQISTELHELQLMDSKTGSPFGSGMGDVFTNRVYGMKEISFPKKGIYSIKVKQYMRKNPIDEILSFGIRIEKVE
jgi:gliding motility-associated lipoprotein GldH